jgi:BirA family biotin operon repressor/biotin-[acetyl-CoA-carboxylase] ligase
VSSRRADLVRLLADGQFHSGETLAAALGVTRAAVSKQVRSLGTWGLDVESAPRRGHRLAHPLDLLSSDEIRAALAPATAARLRHFEVHDEIGSTNSRLLAVGDLPGGRFDACLAEFQSAGRGRRGRDWLAPFGSGLCLSYAWLFRDPPAELSSLSLAVGIAAVRALRVCGVDDVRLKWPNDLLAGERKLGGILCELRVEAAGPAYVVIGIGLNVALSVDARARIDAAAVAAGGLAPATLADRGPAPSRNRLAAAVLDALTAMAEQFEARGFAPFHAEWSRADALAGRAVRVLAHRAERAGVARGIALDGALLVEIGGRVERVTSGEVSLRVAA